MLAELRTLELVVRVNLALLSRWVLGGLLGFATTFALAVSAYAQQAQAPGAGNAVAGVLGFQVWKTSRVDEAKAALEKLRSEPVRSATPSGPVSKVVRGDSRLQQAQLNVEIAQELTVNDYFVLYLNQFKEKEAFLEAAKKLTPDEMAELMLAYKKHLSGASQEAMSSEIIMNPGRSALGRPARSTL